MSAPFAPASSLRTRILLTTAGTVTVLMMLISWGILAQWRQTILEQERSHALAITRAFSVTVIDAMILEGNDLGQAEGFLDNYVAGFMRENPRLRYIAIEGPHGETVARSMRGAARWNDVLPAGIVARREPATWFGRIAGLGWVEEAYCPLATGQKRWGSLLVGIEADSVRGEIGRVFFLLFGLSVIVTGLMITLLWILLGRLLRSLRDLVRAMDTLELESAAPAVLPDRRDEIGVLFRHFQEMRGRLGRSRAELLGARQQIEHAERLAAIGRLASGVAHELNNPINGVRNCIYAIRQDPDDRPRVAGYLDLMDEGMTQAASIITKLLGFARRQEPVRVPVVLNDVVQSVVRLLSFDLSRKHIRMQLELQEPLPEVLGDAQLLQEVVMNLLMNAIDAVDSDGAIVVRTHGDAAGRIALQVIDRGKGIAAADLPHVFEPFFTTKGTGEGTGLGLSVSLGIVQAHGGMLAASSTPGAGATFTVDLPALGAS